MSDFTGTIHSDLLIGGSNGDNFDISQGGADTVNAAGGDDLIHIGGAFGADDQIDGGTGNDTVALDGDYSAGVVLGDNTLVHVERLELTAGNSYDLTLSDRAAATATNADFSVAAGGFGVDDQVRIDASAFAAGHRLEFAVDGDGGSTVIGGGGDDTLVFAGAGQFDATGGGGDDTVAIYRAMTQSDHFHGGDGSNDTLVMLASQNTVLSGAMVDGVETLWVYGGDYTIGMRDTAVAAGDNMHIQGGDLDYGYYLDFDGSRERDGTFSIDGSVNADTLIGGRGADTIGALDGDDVIIGGGGADTLGGEVGADTFVYLKLSDSGHHGQFDFIQDLENADTIDLSALDADKGQAGDQAFHIVASFSGHAGELVLNYDADADLTTMSVDVNGDGRADMAVQIAGDHHDFSHFVL